MNQKRNIKQIIPAFKVNMGGIIIDQPLPNRFVEQIDPFLLLHHLDQDYTMPKKQKEVGVPPHPHRGFAPVTFVFKGGVHHRDSLNNDSVIYAGGTQWMHAGKGVIHSERPAKEVAEKAESWELIQFWVNIPAQHKLSEPEYLPLTAEDTPTITSEDGKVKVAVVSGDFNGTKGKIPAYSPILALRFEFEADGMVKIPIPSSYNAFIYQLDGELIVNQQSQTKAKDLVWLENDGDYIEVKATQKTRAILLAGEPLNEPLYTHGPFVMNSKDEIIDAIKDYQTGEMGQLQEVFQ